jgi:polyvinyl alcohol dehydrogenase (cytochrome)
MFNRLPLSIGAIALAAATLSATAMAQTPPDHPGGAVYAKACASCHDMPTGRTAGLATIRGTSPAQLRSILTEGVMQPMAAGLTGDELTQLIGWLTAGQQTAAAAWTDVMMCSSDRRKVDVGAAPGLTSFGGDLKSTRNLTAAQAGLKAGQLAGLEVAWAIGFPQTQGMGVGTTVLGDTAFVNSAGRLFALDTESGCAKWIYAGASSRNTPTIADIAGRKALVFASQRGEIHAVSALDGSLIWKADGRPANGVGSIRGGVVVYKDKIIVPISASGVATAANPKFECCTGHGAVVALSAKDGTRLWEYHTMRDAEYTGEVNALGVKLRGPSGAPIWSVPTIDEARNQVLVSTGENTSHPATDTSDAIIALDLETGKVNWLFQAWGGDVWNMACDIATGKNGPNCPVGKGSVLRDFDFGAQPILAKGAGGKDVVLAGQKSGDVWALDAATGKLIWNQRIGQGTALGGVHWGIAVSGNDVIVPINDPLIAPDPAFKSRAGVYAFEIATGKPVWSRPVQPDCAEQKERGIVNCETRFGVSPAPLVIDGAVLAGTLDGRLLVLDGKTGEVVKTIPTAGPIKTVNGVPGRGGSIDSHAISAGAGTVFVTSGYGAFSQTPGNVLIALRPKAD